MLFQGFYVEVKVSLNSFQHGETAFEVTQWSLITAATPNPQRKGDTSYKQRTERRVRKNRILSMLLSETRSRSG